MQQSSGAVRTRIVLDAMGGDYAPAEPVKGAVDAVNARSDIQVLLVGQEDVVREELAKYTYPGDQIQVVHAEEYGKAEGSRRICVSGKFRCDLSRRTGDCRSHQRH